MRRTLLPTLVLLAGLAASASAQENEASPPEPETAPRQEAAPAGNALDLQLVGGLTTYVNRLHGSAGALVRLHRGAWSGMALGSYGTGGQYTSLLFGGALSRDLLTLGAADLGILAGYARYEETGYTDIRRDAMGPMLGAVATLPMDPLVVTVMFTDVFGSWDGLTQAGAFSYSFHVPRLLLAVGF